MSQRIAGMALIFLTACLLAASSAVASIDALDLYELDALTKHRVCVEACGKNASCLATCPSQKAGWDKDLNGVLTAMDRDIALREYWDEGALDYVCYEKPAGGNTVLVEDPQTQCSGNCMVTLKELCGQSECLSTRSEAQCTDLDSDGLLAWQEEAYGTSDRDPNPECDTQESGECGFSHTCKRLNPPGLEPKDLCQKREDCEGDSCTALHLQLVTVNNNELIMRVVFDYAPKPVKVLDLYLEYDPSALQLVDTRALTALIAAGKKLTASHEDDGLLRLVMLGVNQAEIPNHGTELVELVFNRISNAQTTVSFASNDELQEDAMAPDQGAFPDGRSIGELLRNDDLWGEAIEVPAKDPSGPRLLLYYGFDNPARHLDYSDVLDSVEMCEEVSECDVLDESLPAERTKKQLLTTYMGHLQEGSARVSQPVDGVIGNAAFFDGIRDHLELPTTLNIPEPDERSRHLFGTTPQSFSLSFWFYAEGDLTTDQLLFSQNTAAETTRMGVMARPTQEGIRLFWFQGDILGNTAKLIPIDPSEPLAALQWHHFGMVLGDTLSGKDDDGDGEIDEADESDYVTFYVDGYAVPVELNSTTHETATQVPFYSKGAYRYGDTYKLECPAMEPAGGLEPHMEGDLEMASDLGAPQALYYASSQNNLFGIEQMSMSGLAAHNVVRDGLTQAKDPDYNATLDKLVYASSQSGNFEIWIANGDGSNARPITQGFGDTARKIFARRPTWAPDGSAIVFESNVYSVENIDNTYRRVYHLYYLQYDAQKNEVAIPDTNGAPRHVLNYDTILANGLVPDFRITASRTSTQNYHVVWKQGRYVDPTTKKQMRGRLWFNTSDPAWEQKQVLEVAIPEFINSIQGGTPQFGTDVDGELECRTVFDSYEMLDAYHVTRPTPAGQNPITWSEMVYRYEKVEYREMDESQPRFTFAQETEPLPGDSHYSDKITITVSTGPGFDADDSEVPGVYIKYNSQLYTSNLKASDTESGALDIVTGAHWPDPYDGTKPLKEVLVSDAYTKCSEYVKVRIKSVLDGAIGKGTKIAKVIFYKKLNSEDEAFELFERAAAEELRLRDLAHKVDGTDNYVDGLLRLTMEPPKDAVNPTPIPALETVLEAAFSPSGNQLVISGIQKARPVVMVTKLEPGNYTHYAWSAYGADGSADLRPEIGDNGQDHELIVHANGTVGRVGYILVDKLSTQPMKVEGLSWVAMPRYYPCMWMGAYLNWKKRLFVDSFRGGFDEIKMYSYVREAAAFESDFQRGQAWLVKNGRDQGLEPQTRTCANPFDCPDYMTCRPDPADTDPSDGTDGICEIAKCDPNSTNPCTGGGTCTLMPVALTQGGGAGYDWVCVAECASDKDCFSEECLNGPCRFCDNTSTTPETSASYSCFECRLTKPELSGVVFPEVPEGCPDRNSFYCDEGGSCLTECYSLQNGESQYLCEDGLEYCRQGRCEAFRWDWVDLAPATFSGVSEMVFDIDGLDITAAIPQLYPIEIEAFGVEDYGVPPELLVEAKPVFTEIVNQAARGHEWFRIGQIMVHNKTQAEASQNKYVLLSPYAVSDVRLRLIQPSYTNFSHGSTGLDAKDDQLARQRFDGPRQVCPRWTELGDDNDTDSDVDPNDEVIQCEAPWISDWTYEHSATGSRATIGYRVGVTALESRRACYERGNVGCKYAKDELYEPFLYGGAPTVILKSIKVNGKLAETTSNQACRYSTAGATPFSMAPASALDPLRPQDRVSYPVVYGNPATEISNQRFARYGTGNSESPTQSVANVTSDPLWGGYDLLNCNYWESWNQSNRAYAQYRVCTGQGMADCKALYPAYNVRRGAILETKLGCTVEKGMRLSPCYEWTGDAAADCMSYMAGAKEPWHTLDFDTYRSFGDDGTPRASLPEATDTDTGSK